MNAADLRDASVWKGDAAVVFGTGAAAAAAKYGGALPSGYSRAIVQAPLFDLKPWLGRQLTTKANTSVIAIDTSFACDNYAAELNFVLSGRTRGSHLATLDGVSSLRVWYFERGSPASPDDAVVFRARQDITDEFILGVSEGWRYTVQPSGIRYWTAGLIIEALTASLPSLAASLSMH